MSTDTRGPCYSHCFYSLSNAPHRRVALSALKLFFNVRRGKLQALVGPTLVVWEARCFHLVNMGSPSGTLLVPFGNLGAPSGHPGAPLERQEGHVGDSTSDLHNL